MENVWLVIQEIVHQPLSSVMYYMLDETMLGLLFSIVYNYKLFC